jgi:hypothetical protein
MVLEEIKEWRETLLERITPIAVVENVDWLIAEVEKYQTLNSQQVDPYAQGQEETARRCAEIADMMRNCDNNWAEEIAKIIRREYSL